MWKPRTFLAFLLAALLVAVLGATAADAAKPSPGKKGTAAGTTSTLVGARAKTSGNLAADFLNAQNQLGPLQVTRVFYGTLPVTHRRVTPVGVLEIISFKDSTGANLESFVKSLTHGEMLAFYHEPEGPDDWTDGPAFKSAWRDLYRRSKAANPAVKFGMIAGAFQYRAGGRGYDGSFLPLRMADWFAIDTYRDGSTENGYGAILPLPQVAEFARWYSLVAPTGKPLAVTEYGRGTVGGNELPSADSKRIQVLGPDVQWARDHGFFAFDQWYSNDGNRPWIPTDPAWYDAFKALPRG